MQLHQSTPVTHEPLPLLYRRTGHLKEVMNHRLKETTHTAVLGLLLLPIVIVMLAGGFMASRAIVQWWRDDAPWTAYTTHLQDGRPEW